MKVSHTHIIRLFKSFSLDALNNISFKQSSLSSLCFHKNQKILNIKCLLAISIASHEVLSILFRLSTLYGG